jgi:hypothetical protein
MDKDIKEALNYWRYMNDKEGYRYARFEASQFEHSRVVKVEVGTILYDGRKQSPHHVRYFSEVDGIVYIHDGGL